MAHTPTNIENAKNNKKIPTVSIARYKIRNKISIASVMK